MKIHLIAFGKLRVPGLRETADYYIRNLRPWAELLETELKAQVAPDKSPATRTKIQDREGELISTAIESRLGNRDRFFLLDESGKTMTTAEWAGLLSDLRDESATPAFCVGSHLGFGAATREHSHGILSLGPQTLPHELARVVLLEQIYRAFSVIHRHPYHNEGP